MRSSKTKKFVNQTPVTQVDLVWWQDAYTTSESTPEFSKDQNILTLSIGVIVKEDKEFVHLSHFYDGISGTLSDPFTSIPKGMIKHREKLKIKIS